MMATQKKMKSCTVKTQIKKIDSRFKKSEKPCFSVPLPLNFTVFMYRINTSVLFQQLISF